MKTVLLLEPDTDVQRSITRALDHYGARVCAPRERREASQVLRGMEVHIVIASVDVPEDAAECLAMLEEAREIRPQALRALMAGRESERIAAARRDGLVQQLLLKPFGMAEVAALVEAAKGR